MTPVFRPLALPHEVRGRVYLASMPGRYEHLAAALGEMDRLGIQRIVCLTPDREIADKAPEYARALANGGVGRPCERYDVADYRAPAIADAFGDFVGHVAARVREGEHLLVHCAGGIGRTGTFAVCLLLALGWPIDRARDAVAKAGSRPESDEQNAFLRLFATRATSTAVDADRG